MSDQAASLPLAKRSTGSATPARRALRRRRAGGEFLGRRRAGSLSSASSASDADSDSALSDSDTDSDAETYPARKPKMPAFRRRAALAGRRSNAPARVAARAAVTYSSGSDSPSSGADSPSSASDSEDSPSSGPDSDTDSDDDGGRGENGQGAPDGAPSSAVPSLGAGTPGTAYGTRPIQGRMALRQRRRRAEPAGTTPYPVQDASSASSDASAASSDASAASSDACSDSDVDEAAACRRKHGQVPAAARLPAPAGKRGAVAGLPASIPAPADGGAEGSPAATDDEDVPADGDDDADADADADGDADADDGEEEALPGSIAAPPPTANTTAGEADGSPMSTLLTAPPAATTHMPVPLPPMGGLFQQPVDGDGARIDAASAGAGGLTMAAPGLATLVTYAVLARCLMRFFA